jgi:hypothetical protein
MSKMQPLARQSLVWSVLLAFPLALGGVLLAPTLVGRRWAGRDLGRLPGDRPDHRSVLYLALAPGRAGVS